MVHTYAETCHRLQLYVLLVILTLAQRGGAEHIDIEH
jgi:hypothetical protein